MASAAPAATAPLPPPAPLVATETVYPAAAATGANTSARTGGDVMFDLPTLWTDTFRALCSGAHNNIWPAALFAPAQRDLLTMRRSEKALRRYAKCGAVDTDATHLPLSAATKQTLFLALAWDVVMAVCVDALVRAQERGDGTTVRVRTSDGRTPRLVAVRVYMGNRGAWLRNAHTLRVDAFENCRAAEVPGSDAGDMVPHPKVEFLNPMLPTAMDVLCTIASARDMASKASTAKTSASAGAGTGAGGESKAAAPTGPVALDVPYFGLELEVEAVSGSGTQRWCLLLRNAPPTKVDTTFAPGVIAKLVPHAVAELELLADDYVACSTPDACRESSAALCAGVATSVDDCIKGALNKVDNRVVKSSLPIARRLNEYVACFRHIVLHVAAGVWAKGEA